MMICGTGTICQNIFLRLQYKYLPKISVPIVSSLVGSAFFCSHQEEAVSMGSCSYKFSEFLQLCCNPRRMLFTANRNSFTHLLCIMNLHDY